MKTGDVYVSADGNFRITCVAVDDIPERPVPAELPVPVELGAFAHGQAVKHGVAREFEDELARRFGPGW